MKAVRALYNGTKLRPLPSELLPPVAAETQVIVIFDDVSPDTTEMLRLQRQQALNRLRDARGTMASPEPSIREMIEDGRNR